MADPAIDLLDPTLHGSGEIDRVLDRLRDATPVVWCRGRRGPGYWSITGHLELVAAAKDTDGLSSNSGTRPEVRRPAGARRALHNLDPPAHGALREVAQQAVSPARLAAFDTIASSIAGETVVAFVRAGGGDAQRDLAEPIAARALAAWLGVDASELLDRVNSVHAAGAALVDCTADDRATRAGTARRAELALREVIELAIGDRSREGVLVELRPGFALHDLEDLVRFGMLCAEALPSLVDAIGGAIVDLATHPGLAPSPLLVEELLRRASPTAQFARRATRRVELGGKTIEPGQQVVLWFGAANRDSRVFRAPAQLVPDRAPNPHLAFGVGPHRCLGAGLARRVLQAVIVALASHRLRLAGEPVRRPANYQRGFERIPITIEVAVAARC